MWKCNQSRPGFELVSSCPIPTTITITPRAPRRPVLKRSLTGLNLEIFFLLDLLPYNVKKCSQPYYLFIAGRDGENSWIHTLPKRYWHYMKCKKPRPGFELESPFSFSTMIIITSYKRKRLNRWWSDLDSRWFRKLHSHREKERKREIEREREREREKERERERKRERENQIDRYEPASINQRKLFAFHFVLMPLGKAWIHLFSYSPTAVG